MDQLLAFAKEYWVILALVLVAVFVINTFLKAVFRIVNIGLVIGAILVLGFNYSPSAVVEMGRDVVSGVNEVFVSTVKPLIESEIKDADYTFHEDGSYEIKTKNIRITAKKGDPTATVYYKDFSFKVNIDDLGVIAKEQMKQAEATH
ncbi:hypothetical protein [Brevibacillus dissolubilis]|uniref:hypothetical protein n=1 Tax=Brevibacillus dissolubilis TaxID=1844116 RepID=UPI0011177F8C|nr:hypothetical protein [Brevibacillus dissolubilis]